MISLLRTNQFYGALIVLLIAISAFTPFFLNISEVEMHGTYGILDDWFYSLYEYPYWMLSVFFITTLLIAFTFQSWLDYHKIIEKDSYFPVFFVILILIGLPQNVGFTPILAAIFILLFGLIELFKIYENRPILGPIFNASFLFSTAALIYNPLILLIPYVWIIYLTSGSVNGRGLIVSLTGILIPFLYLFTYSFYTDTIYETWELTIADNVDFLEIHQKISFTLDWVYVLLMLLMTGIIAYFYLSHPSNYKIIQRKYYISFSILFIWTMSLLLFSGKHYIQHLQLAAISLSTGLSLYFATTKKKRQAEIALWCIFMICIAMHVVFHIQS